MALQADNTLISNRELLVELVLAPFHAFVRLMEKAAETNARTQALRAVADLSDAQLEARGLTRAEAIDMVFQHDA